ncbi:hypothetical protein [Mongoliibacter ruber]|uniref:Uncharacterized protein n=1 Tax=Mongoliibacter ruber TaxID=1750599 RepID=A0A2T0WCP1_9BACT|nr:hypothetical protein [Mongoliibacter ruber]PRY84473.1 hypothetical protein CLW00_12019 [Mongoliibacter ruber]
MRKSDLILYFANQISKRIVKTSIRQFQSWHITLSGNDSRLKNTWDEICVQIQGEYSFNWNDYVNAIETHLMEEVRRLNEYEKFSLWLQTDQGLYYDEEENETPEIYDEDIMYYLKSEIFKKAGNWSNERIRKYLG